ALTVGLFGRNDCRSASDKRIVDRFTVHGMMHDGPAHALHRLLRSVSREGVLGFPFTALGQPIANGPKRGLTAITLPMGRVGAPDGIPARFMLHMIMTATDREMGFGPDDLAADLKIGCFEALGHDDGPRSRVPDIGNRPGKQFPCLSPIGTIIV